MATQSTSSPVAANDEQLKQQRQGTTGGLSNDPNMAHLQNELQDIIGKLKQNPSTVTLDYARTLQKYFATTDERTAKLIKAIEASAAANCGTAESTEAGSRVPRTVVQDLLSSIEKHPGDVNADVIKLAQRAVTNMQKVMNTSGTPPHPELESALQQEFAKIEPKVQQGTVTKAEANHLHSLEARAHGHTEKGGLTSVAQSVAARRKRQKSISNGSHGQREASRQGLTPEEQSHKDKEDNLHKVEIALRPKVENDPEHVTKEDASLLMSREERAHGVIEKGSLAAEAQSVADKNINLNHAKDTVAGKDGDKITKDDAALLQSRKARAHGTVEAADGAAQVQSLADKNENQATATAE